MEAKKRCRGTEAMAPEKGPTMNTQKWEGQVPLTMAGPRLRAGLMEQPAGGGRGDMLVPFGRQLAGV